MQGAAGNLFPIVVQLRYVGCMTIVQQGSYCTWVLALALKTHSEYYLLIWITTYLKAVGTKLVMKGLYKSSVDSMH